GNTAVHLGGDQVLLQRGVSDEDGVARPGDRLHVHRTPKGGRSRRGRREPATEQAGGLGVARALVRRRGRGTVDRILWVARVSRASSLLRPYFFGSVGSLPSRGAPVPDEPRKSFRPSGNVRSLPFALSEPSLA